MHPILQSFAVIMQWDCLLALFIGVVGGMVIGIIPGLGPSAGIALLIPITFTMRPEAALIMMVAMYASGVYGGSITAILCHTPGTAASAATAIDGYALTKKGRGAEAVGMATIASVFGGCVGALALIFFAPPLGRFSMRFSALEYFLIASFGLIVVSNLTGKAMAKGLFAAALGLLIGTVGMDPMTGVQRFTFGSLTLEDGIDYTPVLIGLFSLSQALVLVENMVKGKNSIFDDPSKNIRGSVIPEWSELKKSIGTICRSSVIGAFIGFIPAAGASIASWINYGIAKKSSKNPEEYGNGSLDGIAASESGNNAACGGAMIPLFTLGIPGSAATAIMFGGMLMHGLIPGSKLFTEQAVSTYTIFLGFLFANILMGIIGLSLSRQLSKVCIIPNAILVPLIISVSIIGTYSLNNNLFEVWLMIGFGILGYFMKMYDFETAPLVLGIVLCDILESNFRRAIILSRGNMWKYFCGRPISIVVAVCILITLFSPIIVKWFKKTVQKQA